MEIVPGVHSIPHGRGAFTGLFPPNVYLIAGPRAIMVDSGYEEHAQVRLDYLREHGFSLEYIVITHPHVDHIGGARIIKQATGARILVHSADAAAAAGAADGTVAEGQVLSSGETEAEVVHTPGHTPGHICLFLRSQGVFFSGDHVLGLGTTVITLPNGGDMGRYMASLEKVLAYPMKLICPGHGPIVQRAPEKVTELLQHRREREAQVLSCLNRGMHQVMEMVKDIYIELDPRLEAMAQEQVRAHLAKLIQEGKVEAREGAFFLR